MNAAILSLLLWGAPTLTSTASSPVVVAPGSEPPPSCKLSCKDWPKDPITGKRLPLTGCALELGIGLSKALEQRGLVGVDAWLGDQKVEHREEAKIAPPVVVDSGIDVLTVVELSGAAVVIAALAAGIGYAVGSAQASLHH